MWKTILVSSKGKNINFGSTARIYEKYQNEPTIILLVPVI